MFFPARVRLLLYRTRPGLGLPLTKDMMFILLCHHPKTRHRVGTLSFDSCIEVH
jgi:hypothetical protein